MDIDELLEGIPDNKKKEIKGHIDILYEQNRNLQARLIEEMPTIDLGLSVKDYYHTIKNYMTSLKGYSEILKRRMGGGTCDSKYAISTLEIMGRSIDHLLALSQKALSMTSEAYLPEAVDLDNLAKKCIDIAQGFSGENKKVIIEYYGRAKHKAYANGNQLEEAIHNLSINASQSMHEGGKIMIMTEDTRLDTMQYVKITVTDNGNGMTREEIEKAFDPQQTKGLGLAKVKRIVDLYMGRINVRSEPGKGTSFEIYLPAAE